ncbi:MAG: hypothetical protein GWN01_05305 [Nitrosopumilaceae archaeon]|nr:hypothetical protein [Nitrosopumilaceae archaeon]NIU00361.1 hypothetical protein [Nitrosopumilaceae archaeon]NIU86763.1 hypothetical protein [Nitrosopumilaceae archaeon]NIV65463.1 hypothetical protein [Nitrosopumilaceae archaeon]NIX60963.1 hypothetical protein [Nitrosopumilaceae archaeon]
MTKYAVIALAGPHEHARIYHAFLYLFDLVNNGFEAELFLDGEAVKIIDEMEKKPDDIIKPLYDKAVKEGLLKQACNFCASAFNVKNKFEESDIDLSPENSHINIGELAKNDYQLLTV